MTQAAEELRGRAAPLLQPIAGDNPAGENAQYDARHEAVRAEVAKLDAMSGGDVAWDTVVSGTKALLTETSKDMLMGSYLAYGLLQTEGLGGLATGLELMRGMMAEFWESMFPPLKRMRARTNALDWLVSKLELALPTLSLSATDRPALDAVTEAFKVFSALAREKMGDATPGMSPISQALQRLDMKVPKAAAEPEATPPTEQPASNASPPTPAAAASPTPEPASPAADPPASPAAEPPAAPAADAAPDAAARTAAAKWLAPLPGDAPTGIDARYEPEHESMRTEVAKLESAQGDAIDWTSVGKLAGTILETKSKDVLASCYLAFSAWETRGLPGLADGLAVVVGLFETFETDRWPKRERGQGNALGWFVGQVDRVLSQYKPAPQDRAPLLALEQLIKAAAAVTRQRLEDNAPGFRPLSDRVTRLLMAIPEPKKEAPPPPKPTPAPTQAAAPKPADPAPSRPSVGSMPATADVGSAEEVGKYLQETGRSLVKAGNLLRRAQLSSPTAYRLIRQGLYLHLDGPPPADAGGKTQVPPLPAPRRQQLELIASNANWAALIEETESALMQFRFCLDLHRLTGVALAGLGHADALAATAGELGAVLRRMPAWPDLLAGDGSPLADATTHDWIAETVATSSQAGGGGASPAGGSVSDGADPEAVTEARKLMAAGKAPAALKVAQDSVEAATLPRHRFTRRLDLAEMCLGAGQLPLARGVFGSLQHELDELGIAEWEPKLAARCLEGLVKTIRTATKKGAPADPAATGAFERLCRLDPAAAARLANP